MHPLSDYSHFEIVFFFRLADKHHQNLDLVSAILRSHPLVTQEKGYNADRLSVASLRTLVRQLLEEDHRIQVAANGDRVPSNTATLVKFTEPPPADDKVLQDAIERIWARSWKRLSDDLIKSVRECDEEGNNLLKQIEELKALDTGASLARPGPGMPSRNGASVAAQQSARTTASPLAAPVPEMIKKGSSPAPANLPPKREGTPAGRTPQPHHPHPLRPLQPIPSPAKAGEPVRPNGAAQVLQAPAGVSQPLSPLPQPGRSASPATLTPRPVPAAADATAKPKLPASAPSQASVPPPPLKWEAPYQGPQHSPSQRPLQPSTARPVPLPVPPLQTAVQPPQQPQLPAKWPPTTPSTPQPTTTVPVPARHQQPTPSTSTPQAVLAPPKVATQAPRPQAPPMVKQAQEAVPAQAAAPPRPPAAVPVPPPANQHAQPPITTTPLQKQRQTPLPPPQQPLQRPTGGAQTPVVPPVPTTAVPIPSKVPQTPIPTVPSRPPVAQQASIQPNIETPQPALVTPRHPPQESSVLRNNAIATLQKRLSGIRTSSFSAPQSPKTPQATTPTLLKTGHSTKWVISSTPSTPGPTDVDISEAQSPAYEQLTSPIQKPATLQPSTPQPTQKHSPKPSSQKLDTTISKAGRSRPSRAAQTGRGGPLTAARRSQSVASQVDELSMDHSDLTGKVKDEVTTPRMPSSAAAEETGDTTADESVASRRTVGPGSVARMSHKRKRRDSEPVVPAGPPTHVQWTRGFQKVSASALDQIGSHRHANMFANPIRERDAPNYSGIVLQPQDIMSIKKAITHGNRVASQTAANLPGGDPGTPVVLLPISEDLVPPKGIINSAQLERELVHMFCNAVMYNPDPDRGPGPGFMKRQQGGDDSLGYQMDEFGVVRNTRDMFVEVDQLLTDLRNAESQRGVPPASAVSLTPRAASAAATGAAGNGAGAGSDDTADDMDELAQDDGTSNASRRKRVKA
ncbi:hypothetical protein jhhlp_008058 [Lomentospora prolificans]|uniref:Bromo domain-containing protein n=1 Tax=Lomentospora prolificans TaxID=41688 RepID=A0A2N3MZD6_9PEZI|nr:hypothetical protein jhhlp_008058 [Lomentospora prolificans]